MNRKFKNAFLVLLMFLCLFSKIEGVKAESNDITLTNVRIESKSESIQVEEPVLEGNNISSNISFNQKDDYVTLELTIKNNSDKKYKISSIEDNLTNDNLSLSYDYEKEYIEKDKTASIFVRLEYKKLLLNVDEISLNNLNIKINFEREDGAHNEIIVNPATGDSILHYLVLLIIALAGIILIVLRKKKKVGIPLLIIATILIPFAALANNRFELNVRFNNISIKGTFEEYQIPVDSKNGDELVIKNITYGQPLGELSVPEKRGYTFDKWVNSDGDTVTSSTVITGPISIEARYNINTYKITYNLDGGNLEEGKSNPATYTVESEDITLNNPIKKGYTFAGWTGSNGDSLQTRVTINTGTIDDLNFVANFNAADDTAYKVIHKYQNLSDLTSYTIEEESLTGVTNSTVHPQIRHRNGFIDPIAQDLIISPNGDSSIEYVYNRDNYSFSISDRTYIDSSSTPDGSYPFETSIIAKAIERPGYSFKWSDNSLDYNKSFIISAPIELTPNYTPNTNTIYRVTHRYQTLNNTYEDEVIEEHGTTDTTVEAPRRSRIGFVTPNPSNVTIFGDESGAVTYVYNRIPCTYQFGQDITSSIEAGTYPYGTEVTVSYIVKPGYTFTGWENGSMDASRTIVLKDNTNISATYSANTNTPYTVHHKYQTLNNTYEEENRIEYGTTDTLVDAPIRTRTGFVTPGVQKVTIAGNGLSEVTYTYDRETYSFTTGENVTSTLPSGTYPYGTEITLTANEVEGSDFVKWSNDSTSNPLTITLTGNLTIEPIYIGSSAVLMDSYSFNQVIDLSHYGEFRKATASEYAEADESELIIISTEDSPLEVYAWVDNDDNVLYYSEAKTIYMNENSNELFEYSGFSKIDLSGLNTSNVVNMSMMFNGCSNLVELDLSSFDTSNVTDMTMMFSSCSNLVELDLSSFDTSNVEDMDGMFSYCSELQTIYVSDGWTTTKVEEKILADDEGSMDFAMFKDAYKLSGEQMTEYTYEFEGYDLQFAHIDGGSSNPGYLSRKGHKLYFSTLINGYDFSGHINNRSELTHFRKATLSEYNEAKGDLTESNIVSTETSMPTYLWQDGNNALYYSEADVIFMNEDSGGMFSYSSFVSIDLTGLDASRVTNMSSMFANCESLTSVNFDGLDTSKVDCMTSMFYNCTSLTEIDLSNLDTSNVIYMNNMFDDCTSLTNVNFGSLENDSSLQGSIVDNNKLAASVMVGDKKDNPNSIILLIPILFIIIGIGIYVVFKTIKPKKVELTVGAIVVIISVISLVAVFGTVGLRKLLASVTPAEEQETISANSFNTSKVENMSYMFDSCTSLTELDLSVFDTSSLTETSYMFYDCNLLETIYVSDRWYFDIRVSDDGSEYIIYYALDINSTQMFAGCESLVGEKGTTFSDILSRDEAGFARVDGGLFEPGYFTYIGHNKTTQDIAYLSVYSDFHEALRSLLYIEGEGSESERRLMNNFRKATSSEYNLVKDSLTDNNIISTNESPYPVYIWIKDDEEILYYSEASVIYLNSNSNNMFENLYIKNIDLSGMDGSHVTNMYSMFSDCISLETVDLSSFDNEKTVTVYRMFENDSNLTTIYVSDAWNIVYDDSYDNSNMFDDCTSLVGGAGTQFDPDYSGTDYAHIDGGQSNPGYFTLKTN